MHSVKPGFCLGPFFNVAARYSGPGVTSRAPEAFCKESVVEHEASTSHFILGKGGIMAVINCLRRRSVSMIINGFVRDVFMHLPMEFAVEATKLLGLKLEGSVG